MTRFAVLLAAVLVSVSGRALATTPPVHRAELPFRQVHLDFHTSGKIPDVGVDFDRARFQAALKAARVNSVTLFAKDHHGYSYHPTKVGRMHPHLKRNLLAEQIAACREIGVRCPIYVSTGLDELMAMEHPEWVVKNRDGSTYRPLEVGWFKLMRFNSPYLDYVCAQIEELNELFPDNDGFFLDIVSPRMDYSEGALQEMQALKLDPEKLPDVERYGDLVLQRYLERSTAAARSRNPHNGVFHNSGNLSIGAREMLAYNSHLELESLPTGGWGWDHFPLTGRYAQTTGFDLLGMTGKFHTMWGEFDGFKRAASLRYECATMLALGAKCSIGDQLHPSGAMNEDTYALIGAAYAEVERKEPWCTGARPLARIALVSSARQQHRIRGNEDTPHDDEGIARMLLELHLPFQVLDARTPWTGYDVIVLGDKVWLTPELLAEARAHLGRGGRLIAAGQSLLNPEQNAFALDPGARLVGRGELDPDYLVAAPLAGDVPVRSPVVIHGKAWNAEPTEGTALLASRADSYFNRTWRHFSSHQHAPDAGASPYPGAILNRDRTIVWFAHDLFTRYRAYGQPLYRDFFRAALKQVFPQGLPMETSLPVAGRTSLMEQEREGRFVVHLLYATPTAVGAPSPATRNQAIQIVEDFVPLHQVKCRVQLPKAVKAARLVPGGETIAFTQHPGAVEFVVPRVECHQMVELSYR